jgi:hypothetical protein
MRSKRISWIWWSDCWLLTVNCWRLTVNGWSVKTAISERNTQTSILSNCAGDRLNADHRIDFQFIVGIWESGGDRLNTNHHVTIRSGILPKIANGQNIERVSETNEKSSPMMDFWGDSTVLNSKVVERSSIGSWSKREDFRFGDEDRLHNRKWICLFHSWIGRGFRATEFLRKITTTIHIETKWQTFNFLCDPGSQFWGFETEFFRWQNNQKINTSVFVQPQVEEVGNV